MNAGKGALILVVCALVFTLVHEIKLHILLMSWNQHQQQIESLQEEIDTITRRQFDHILEGVTHELETTDH